MIKSGYGYDSEIIKLTKSQCDQLQEINELVRNEENHSALMGQVFPGSGELFVQFLPSGAAHGVKDALAKHAPINKSEVPEPSAMSELAGWIDEEKPSLTESMNKLIKSTKALSYAFNRKPKKLSWLQKIRGYDKLVKDHDGKVDVIETLQQKYHDLQARCAAAESMRDHHQHRADAWKSIAREKAGELKLMEKVADNWQQKLIDQNAIIGKRLKFSVGHNHITIIVGNPICVAENYNAVKPLKNGRDCATAYSNPSKKDVYNWKTGVIQALENLCNFYEYPKTLRRDLRKALANKYPEVFVK